MSASDDAARWDSLAAEANELANEMTDPESRRVMLNIAAAYARLAERARQRAQNKPEK